MQNVRARHDLKLITAREHSILTNLATLYILMIWYPSGNGGVISADCTFPGLSVALTTIL